MAERQKADGIYQATDRCHPQQRVRYDFLSGWICRHEQLSCALELVAGPQCPVVKVAPWLTLLNELARIENSVVRLKPEVAIH